MAALPTRPWHPGARRPAPCREGTVPTLAALTRSSAPVTTALTGCKLYTMNNTPYRGSWRLLGHLAA